MEVPARVPEVAAQLSEDRRHGEGREGQLPGEVEAVDGLDEPHRGDLDEVLERLARARVPGGEGARERDETLDDLVARALVALLVIAREQAPCLALPRRIAGAEALLLLRGGPGVRCHSDRGCPTGGGLVLLVHPAAEACPATAPTRVSARSGGPRRRRRAA